MQRRSIRPKVTIVTVSYQARSNIEDTILSVMNQTYDNVEYIVVDGGSTDGTRDVIHEYKDGITQWVSERDRGIYDAMNKGIMMAALDSEYILFMNCGDRFYEDKTLEKLIDNRPLDGNFYGDYVKEGKRMKQPGRLSSFYLSTKMICHQSIIFQTNIHRNFLYDITYDISADYKVLLAMYDQKIKFTKINQIVCFYEGGGISDIHRQKLFRQREEIIREHQLIKAFYYSKGLVKKWLGRTS